MVLVRPDQYIEINNFYTATVYEKGSEVIRMLHTLLGEDGFQKGIKLYFERHDGQAVTCDDFAAAMADANDTDLSHFKLWYSQAGTPKQLLVHNSEEHESSWRMVQFLGVCHVPCATSEFLRPVAPRV